MRLSAFTALSGVPVVPMMGTLPPPSENGWATSPLLASWSQKVRAGQPVTIDEHNAMVAQLAFSRTILSQTGPLALPALPTDDGRRAAVVLGASAFQDRPAATTAAPPASAQSPILNVIAGPPLGAMLSDQARREWCTVADGAGAMLRLEPEMIVANTAPSGAPFALLAAIPAAAYGTVAFVMAAGVFAFAAYRGFTNAQAQETQRVRIRYDSVRAQRVDEMNQQLQSQTARWAASRAAGRDIAPGPIETRGVSPIPDPNRPPPSTLNTAIDALKDGLVTVGGYGAIALGFTALVGVGERMLARRELRRTMGAL